MIPENEKSQMLAVGLEAELDEEIELLNYGVHEVYRYAKKKEAWRKILSDEQVLDISQDLDIGFMVYVHRQTGEIIKFPKGIEDEYMDEEENLWAKDMEKVEKNADDYVCLRPMESHESFGVMEGFAETVEDASIRKKLLSALNNRKPFRGFRDILDNDGNIDDWYAFKMKSEQARLKQELEYAFDDEESED